MALLFHRLSHATPCIGRGPPWVEKIWSLCPQHFPHSGGLPHPVACFSTIVPLTLARVGSPTGRWRGRVARVMNDFVDSFWQLWCRRGNKTKLSITHAGSSQSFLAAL